MEKKEKKKEKNKTKKKKKKGGGGKVQTQKKANEALRRMISRGNLTGCSWGRRNILSLNSNVRQGTLSLCLIDLGFSRRFFLVPYFHFSLFFFFFFFFFFFSSSFSPCSPFRFVAVGVSSARSVAARRCGDVWHCLHLPRIPAPQRGSPSKEKKRRKEGKKKKRRARCERDTTKF